MKQHYGFTNAMLSIIIALLLFIIGAMGYSLWSEKNHTTPTPTPTPMASETISPTPSMTPSVTLTPTHTPSVTPTPTVSELIQLQEAFAKKYNRKTTEVNVTVSKNDGSHISGGISFEGEMGGGWFLAAKSNGAWVIVQDGNGTIDCARIAPYNFSSTMVPECWDNTTQKLIKR